MPGVARLHSASNTSLWARASWTQYAEKRYTASSSIPMPARIFAAASARSSPSYSIMGRPRMRVAQPFIDVSNSPVRWASIFPSCQFLSHSSVTTASKGMFHAIGSASL